VSWLPNQAGSHDAVRTCCPLDSIRSRAFRNAW